MSLVKFLSTVSLPILAVSALNLSANSSKEWSALTVPGEWASTSSNLAAYDGFAWYRAYVMVPREWEGSRLLLTVGKIADVDEAFFNGVKIGANGSMPPLFGNPSSSIRRPFVIDPDLIRFGAYNLIAWRIYDNGGDGGIIEGPVHLSRRDDAIDLAGTWQFRTGDSPAWSNWNEDPDSSNVEIEAFLSSTGDRPAGFNGIVPADIGGRQRAVQDVYDRFKDNKSVHALVEGKGAAKPPEQAHETLELSEGLAVDLVLHEPLVRQPLYVEFDERGRLWVTQYIQYPNPAGLEVLTWDNHLRKVFDRVPPPPPYRKTEHQLFIGADKISIHEDSDGDGVFDRHKVFVDGLNLATSTAVGHGGVWVMNPPYLLFYPDEDRDDIPDADPVVHLSGFGLEDTHSIANSLKWGPDGWLYGATGSTVTARVKAELSGSKDRLTFFGQNIWRYHPEQHLFELFAEGGWNTFGVDFDAKGRLYSGTNGNLQSVYFVQGGYYQKNFGKHGPHTNPYTFGHFYGLPIVGERVRLVHQWIRYNGGAIPWFEDHLIGPDSLANKVHALRVEADGSTFKTFEIENPIKSEDKWFRPVHATTGPDGAIYVSDFYDARITHVDPRDNWDRSNGRIYRLRRSGSTPVSPFDLAQKSSRELATLLTHENHWFRTTARRLLAERKDLSILPFLNKSLSSDDAQLALESLWVIHWLEQFNDSVALQSLSHADQNVRAWGIRLLGDPKQSISEIVHRKVLNLAVTDSHPEVISQLAATAQRLPSHQSSSVVMALAGRSEFSTDPYIPQQIWWAFESLIHRDSEAALGLLDDPRFWRQSIVAEVLAERVGRRFMADRNEANLEICAQLLAKAPTDRDVKRLIGGMEKALQGSELDVLPTSLANALTRLWENYPPDASLIGFALRLGSQEARSAALEFVKNSNQPLSERSSMIAKLAELRDLPSQSSILKLATDDSPAPLRLAALNGLRRYESEALAAELLRAYPMMSGDVQRTAQNVLSSRPSWGSRLLAAVADGKIARETVSYDNLLIIKSRNRAADNQRISQLWGELRQPEAAKLQKIENVRELLATGPGDPSAGKALYEVACGLCHRLHSVGREVGPELTGYERDNLDFLIPAVVDPNLGVREEYEFVTVTLRTDREGAEAAVVAGFVSDIGNQHITISDLVGNKTTIAKKDIASEERSPISIMPEGLLDSFDDRQIRDLFAFLQSE